MQRQFWSFSCSIKAVLQDLALRLCVSLKEIQAKIATLVRTEQVSMRIQSQSRANQMNLK